MTQTPTRPQRQAGKATGAWADGDRTPLNPNEEFKQADDGLNVRARIEEVYAREGFASIPGEDLRGRMRWWGLYTQRKPGIDGGKTATLDPSELDAEYFMLRVRSDGGALDADQLRTVAQISQEFARDTADVTDRQNIQLHWIRVEDVPEIWQPLESVGLTTAEACGDTPARHPRLTGGGHRGRRGARRQLGRARDPRPLHRQPRVLQPAPQVQDRDLGQPEPRRRARGQRHLVRGRRPPRARAGLRRVGRRRPVDQPDLRAAPRRLGAARGGPRRLEGRRRRSSATTATGACATAPA